MSLLYVLLTLLNTVETMAQWHKQLVCRAGKRTQSMWSYFWHLKSKWLMKMQDTMPICAMRDKRSKCCAVQCRAGHLPPQPLTQFQRLVTPLIVDARHWSHIAERAICSVFGGPHCKMYILFVIHGFSLSMLHICHDFEWDITPH